MDQAKSKGMFGCRGSGWAASIGCWFTVILVASQSMLAQEPAPQRPVIRRALVPAERPAAWPKGDWIPIAQAEFDTLVRDAAARSEPRAVAINLAAYTGTLAGDALSGQCQWDVQRFVDQPAAMRLESHGVSFANIRWSDGKAVAWGLAPGGESQVIIDRPRGQIVAEWRTPARRLTVSREVSLRFPVADISELQLDLPADFLVRSLAGTANASAEPQGGRRTWRIHPDRSRECQLLIRPTTSTAEPAALLVQHDFSGVVRPEGLRMQCGFQLEVLGAAKSEIEFVVSPDFQVLFVQLADGRPLTCRETSAPGEKRLRVDLPIAETSPRLAIRMQGLVPPSLDRPWTLPRVRVADGILLDGQFALRVDGPLELTLLKLQGCRQAGVVVEPFGSEVTLLKQFEADATIEVLIRSRPFTAACRVTNRFDFNGPHATLRTDVAWEVRSGELFSTRYRIAEGWDVHDIEMQDGEDPDLSAWSVRSEPGYGRVLTVDFRSSLASERPKWLRVLLRRTDVEPLPSSFVPVVLPLDTDDVEQHVTPRGLPGWPARDDTASASSDRLRVVSLELESHLSCNRTEDDRHVARFRVQTGAGPDPVRFEWSLPETTDITRVTVNGGDETPRTDGTVWSVDLDPRRIRHQPTTRRGTGAGVTAPVHFNVVEVAVEFRRPASSRFGPMDRTVVVPKVALATERFVWRMTASERVYMDGDPRGVTRQNRNVIDNWRTRLFGPLGRGAASQLFNPLRPQDWIDAWTDSLGNRPARGTVEVVDSSPPIRRRIAALQGEESVFDSAEAPSEIRLRLWRESDAALLGWTVLFGAGIVGLLMRLLFATRIDWLTFVLGLAALAVAFLAPPVTASIGGATITGLLAAQLVPRSWMRRPAVAQPRSHLDVPTGSTRSFVVSAAMRSLLVAAALTGGALTRADVDEPTSGPGPATINVLIPIDPVGQPVAKPAVVYVAAELHSQLRELQKQHRGWRQRELPAYLLSSSAFDGAWDAEDRLRLTAKFAVQVLSSADMVPVEIRLGGGNLARVDGCLVNGQPHPVLPIEAEGASGFVVPLRGLVREAGGGIGADRSAVDKDKRTAVPGDSKSSPSPSGLLWRTDLIELQVQPVTAIDGPVATVDLKVPPVVDSTVTLRQLATRNTVDVAGLIESGLNNVPGREVAAASPSGWLASPDRLQVRWSSQALPPAEVAAIRAKTLCLVDVQNSHLTYHFQTVGQVTDGNVRLLPLRVPRDALVRSVRVRDTSPSVVPEVPNPFPAVEVVEAGVVSTPADTSAPSELHRFIGIELPRRLPREFVIELEALLPLLPDASDAILPAADLLVENSVGLTVTASVPLIAVRAPVVMQIEVSSKDDEAVRPASDDEIVGVWNDVAKLSATFAVLNPTTLHCRMSRPRPNRIARSVLDVRVGSGRLDCVWSADVETRTTPAYLHQIRMDPRLRIVEASVIEDAAERLLRWTKVGDVVTLFLSDKTISRQALRLHAVMRIQSPQEVPLPRIDLLNASVEESQLVLRQSPDVGVDVVQPANLERVNAPNTTAPNTTEATRNPDRLLGRFRLDGRSEPILLRVQPADPAANSIGDGGHSSDVADRRLANLPGGTQQPSWDDWLSADRRKSTVRVGLWLLAVLMALGLRRIPLRNWLDQRETISLLLLGIVWWICWSPSAIGFAIIPVAVGRGLFARRDRGQTPVEAPDDVGAFAI
jgi:hypothetical protein